MNEWVSFIIIVKLVLRLIFLKLAKLFSYNGRPRIWYVPGTTLVLKNNFFSKVELGRFEISLESKI
jgi:hypothetical protein